MDHRIQAVAELGREEAAHGLFALALAPLAGEADGVLGLLRRPGVGGEDEDDIAKIDCAAVWSVRRP